VAKNTTGEVRALIIDMTYAQVPRRRSIPHPSRRGIKIPLEMVAMVIGTQTHAPMPQKG
jgi:hypothetical protein